MRKCLRKCLKKCLKKYLGIGTDFENSEGQASLIPEQFRLLLEGTNLVHISQWGTCRRGIPTSYSQVACYCNCTQNSISFFKNHNDNWKFGTQILQLIQRSACLMELVKGSTDLLAIALEQLLWLRVGKEKRKKKKSYAQHNTYHLEYHFSYHVWQLLLTLAVVQVIAE